MIHLADAYCHDAVRAVFHQPCPLPASCYLQGEAPGPSTSRSILRRCCEGQMQQQLQPPDGALEEQASLLWLYAACLSLSDYLIPKDSRLYRRQRGGMVAGVAAAAAAARRPPLILRCPLKTWRTGTSRGLPPCSWLREKASRTPGEPSQASGCKHGRYRPSSRSLFCLCDDARYSPRRVGVCFCGKGTCGRYGSRSEEADCQLRWCGGAASC